MDPQEVQQFVSKYWPYLLAFNFVIGIVFGLIPFFLGRGRGQRTLGLAGLIVTPIVGIPSLLLGILSAVVFAVIIIIRGKRINFSDRD
ncbi:MAG: hypothetical protein ACJ73D_08525 [Pyrinomonadaceae bacterium]